MTYAGPVVRSRELERVLALPRREPDFKAQQWLDLAWSWSPMLLNEAGKAEWDRIVALPELERDREFARFARRKDQFEPDANGNLIPGVGCPLLLLPEQAAMLYEAFHVGGLFASAGVGSGKTLVSLLLALILGSARPLLLIPGGLDGKTHEEFADLARYWKVPRPLPQIVSFEKLQGPKSEKLLCDCMRCMNAKEEPPVPGGIRPTHVFVDESDGFQNPKSARTRRLSRFMSKHPETFYAGMTGSAWDKSINDSAPQIIWALKFRAPVPLTYTDRLQWSEALDLTSREQVRDPGALCWLAGIDPDSIETYEERLDIAAEAFKNRLLWTPGIVQTAGQSCSQPLTIRLLKAPEDPLLNAAFKHFRKTKTTLDGWDVDDPLTMLKHATEMSCGFYYIWWNEVAFKKCLEEGRNALPPTERQILSSARTIGNGVDIAQIVDELRREIFNKGPAGSRVALAAAVPVICGQSTAAGLWASWATVLRSYPALFDLFDAAVSAARPPKEWLAKRSAAAKFVQEKIAASARAGKPLDSRAPVYSAYPDEPVLREWLEIEPTFVPVTVARPITASVLCYAVEWLKVNSPALVWVQHEYVGASLSAMSGVPFFGSKGKDPSGRYIGKHNPQLSAILSLDANMKGRNLQAWNRNLALGAPSSAKKWEQAICGRTHRQGQNKPVYVDMIVACAENVRALEKARAKAMWQDSRAGASHRLLIAQYDWTYYPAAELDALPVDHPARDRWVRPN